MYGRADGMPSAPQSVVVCAGKLTNPIYKELKNKGFVGRWPFKAATVQLGILSALLYISLSLAH